LVIVDQGKIVEVGRQRNRLEFDRQLDLVVEPVLDVVLLLERTVEDVFVDLSFAVFGFFVRTIFTFFQQIDSALTYGLVATVVLKMFFLLVIHYNYTA
jgi:hypothetical protein